MHWSLLAKAQGWGEEEVCIHWLAPLLHSCPANTEVGSVLPLGQSVMKEVVDWHVC